MASPLIEDNILEAQLRSQCACVVSKCVQFYIHLLLSNERLDSLDGFEFEQTYRHIYDLTFEGHGAEVYEVLLEELEWTIRRIVSAIESDLIVDDFDLRQRPSTFTQLNGAPLSLLLGYLKLSEVRGVSAVNTSIRLYASEVLEACAKSSVVLEARRRVGGRAQKQLAVFWDNVQLISNLCDALAVEDGKWTLFPNVEALADDLLEQGVGDLLRRRLGPNFSGHFSIRWQDEMGPAPAYTRADQMGIVPALSRAALGPAPACSLGF